MDGDLLADRPLGRLLDLARLQGLQGDLAADELLLEDLIERPEAVFGRGAQDQLGVAQFDLGVGPFEVEPGSRLAVGLIDRIADLLHVHLGHDVERRHGGHHSQPPLREHVGPGPRSARRALRGTRRDSVSARGSVPEWPKGAGCKPAGIAFEGSNPSRPTKSGGPAPVDRLWGAAAPSGATCHASAFRYNDVTNVRRFQAERSDGQPPDDAPVGFERPYHESPRDEDRGNGR